MYLCVFNVFNSPYEMEFSDSLKIVHTTMSYLCSCVTHAHLTASVTFQLLAVQLWSISSLSITEELGRNAGFSASSHKTQETRIYILRRSLLIHMHLELQLPLSMLLLLSTAHENYLWYAE